MAASWVSPAALLVGSLLLAPLPGDVDRDRPKPLVPEVDRERHDEHDQLHQRLAEESKANLGRIAELMTKIQQELAERRTGESTQTHQSDVVKKLDELIDELSKG